MTYTKRELTLYIAGVALLYAVWLYMLVTP